MLFQHLTLVSDTMREVLWNIQQTPVSHTHHTLTHTEDVLSDGTWWLHPAGRKLYLDCKVKANGEADQMLIYWLVNDQFPEDAPSHGRIEELEEWVSALWRLRSTSSLELELRAKRRWRSCGWAGFLFQEHSEERHSPAQEVAVEAGRTGRPQVHLHLCGDKRCRKHAEDHHLERAVKTRKRH